MRERCEREMGERWYYDMVEKETEIERQRRRQRAVRTEGGVDRG